MSDLDTPVLEVHLDAVERNIARMQDYCDANGVRLLPHVKTHKLPPLAELQLRAGAAGITCQKLGEAEVMARAGIRDILISFPLVGAAKARRLAELSRIARVTVAADSTTIVDGLAGVLADEPQTVDVLVDCDTGFGRTGVQSVDEAVELALRVERLPGLRFAGLMTHPTPADDRFLAAAREAIERRGLQVGRVSGGGTPTAFRVHEHPEINELRAGTYVYGDRRCIANGTVAIEDCALRVRTTVVSRPTRDRAILDAGTKTLTSDAAQAGVPGFGSILEYPDAQLVMLSEEHGHVDLTATSRSPEIGEVVTVIPNHACGVTNLHDEVALLRAGRPAGSWPIEARGKVR